MGAAGLGFIGVQAVLTSSGTWVHYAQLGAERTVCGARVSHTTNPGAASCHRCTHWAARHRHLVLDEAGQRSAWDPQEPA